MGIIGSPYRLTASSIQAFENDNNSALTIGWYKSDQGTPFGGFVLLILKQPFNIKKRVLNIALR